MSDDDVRYTLAELKDFQAGFRRFFDEFGNADYESSVDIYRSGFTTRVKFPTKLPGITPDLTAVAQVTGPALIFQLVEQLVELMEAQQ